MNTYYRIVKFVTNSLKRIGTEVYKKTGINIKMNAVRKILTFITTFLPHHIEKKLDNHGKYYLIV